MRRVALAFALFAFASFARAESLRVVAPANGATLRGGSFAELRWTAAQLPPSAEEWEAFLSVDGGKYYAFRVTPHLDIELRQLHVRRPERRHAQCAHSDPHRRRSARDAFREPRSFSIVRDAKAEQPLPRLSAVGTRRSGARRRSRGSGLGGWRSQRIRRHAAVVDAGIVIAALATSLDRASRRRPYSSRRRIFARSCVHANRALIPRASRTCARPTPLPTRRSPSGLQPPEHLVPRRAPDQSANQSKEKTMKTYVSSILLFALLLLLALPLAAQSPNTATMIVVVVDQTGAVVKDAKVSVVNTATGAVREAVSGSDGSATIPALSLTGTYTVTRVQGRIRQRRAQGHHAALGRDRDPEGEAPGRLREGARSPSTAPPKACARIRRSAAGSTASRSTRRRSSAAR